MREFVKTMKGLADPNRVKIIELLQRRELCVCNITQALGLSQSTASKHQQIFLEAGFLSRNKEGGVGEIQGGRWENQPLCGKILQCRSN